MTDRDQAAQEAAMSATLDAYRHLRQCLDLSAADAAHCMIGCAFFALDQDLSLADCAEQLAQVREILDEREADLRARAS